MRLTAAILGALLVVIVLAPMRCASQRIAPGPSSPARKPSPTLADRGPAPHVAASASAPDWYTPHLPARAAAYHRANRLLLFTGIVWRLLGLTLLLGSGASARARDLAESAGRRL